MRRGENFLILVILLVFILSFVSANVFSDFFDSFKKSQFSPGEVCDNALDDDGDNKVDCNDPDCSGDSICEDVSNNNWKSCNSDCDCSSHICGDEGVCSATYIGKCLPRINYCRKHIADLSECETDVGGGGSGGGTSKRKASQCSDNSLIGDVDGNGVIDNADSQIILNVFTEYYGLPDNFNSCCYDVDENGNIDNTDSQLVLNYFAGISVENKAPNIGRKCIVCNSDADCDSEQSKSFCEENMICSNVIDYFCNNPGTSNSECVVSDERKVCNSCPNGCLNGACISKDICYEDSDCPAPEQIRYCERDYSPCVNTTIVKCFNPGELNSNCTIMSIPFNMSLPYETKPACGDPCEFGCSKGVCNEKYVCEQDSDCTIPNPIVKFCGEQGYTPCVNVTTEVECVNPGTPNANCTVIAFPSYVEPACGDPCEFGCTKGECNGALVCNEDLDCPQPNPVIYCEKNNLCTNLTTVTCFNSGTPNANCSYYQTGDHSCQTCSIGCDNGECIREEEPTFFEVKIGEDVAILEENTESEKGFLIKIRCRVLNIASLGVYDYEMCVIRDIS